MSQCNHVWRDASMPIPKKDKKDLLRTVKSCGNKGWWLKGDEFIYALELIKSGEVEYCKKCKGNKAVKRAAKKNIADNSEEG